ncbi:MAG TPA: GNAT family N-acetyltransferase [Devosia sp.]|nr:GNAT family N-acetyltransferase [Devosia sp.]
MAGRLIFKPVTKARRADFDRLFEAPGSPKYCWCMTWRASTEELKDTTSPTRKKQMHRRIGAGTTVGLLGYLHDEPLAWVSIAPRDTYRRIGGPAATPGENTWSLACMFVRRQIRHQGYGRELIDAAIAYARKRGATAIEAYPVDPKSPSYRFMGFIPAFERLGFEEIGREGARRHVMRLALRG